MRKTGSDLIVTFTILCALGAFLVLPLLRGAVWALDRAPVQEARL